MIWKKISEECRRTVDAVVVSRQVGGKFYGSYYSASSLEEMVRFGFDMSEHCWRVVAAAFCGLLLLILTLLMYHSCHKLTRSKERFSLHWILDLFIGRIEPKCWHLRTETSSWDFWALGEWVSRDSRRHITYIREFSASWDSLRQFETNHLCA